VKGRWVFAFCDFAECKSMLCLIDHSIHKKIRSDWKSTWPWIPKQFFINHIYICNNYRGVQDSWPSLCVVLRNCFCLHMQTFCQFAFGIMSSSSSSEKMCNILSICIRSNVLLFLLWKNVQRFVNLHSV